MRLDAPLLGSDFIESLSSSRHPHMECDCYLKIITSGYATRANSAVSWLILGGWILYSCESPTAVLRSGMGLSRLEAESRTNQMEDRSWYPHRNRRSVLRNRRSSWCSWHTVRNHLRQVASEHLGNLRRMAHPHC